MCLLCPGGSLVVEFHPINRPRNLIKMSGIPTEPQMVKVLVDGRYFRMLSAQVSDSVDSMKGAVSGLLGVPVEEFRLSWARGQSNSSPLVVDVAFRLLGGSSSSLDPLLENDWSDSGCALRDQLITEGSSIDCLNISDSFVGLDGVSPAPAADVLEHYFIDDSMERSLIAPRGYDAFASMLARHVSTAYYPPNFLRSCLPRQADFFVYGPSEVGGFGVVARCLITKGSFFCYEGPLQSDADANEYTLAVPAVSTPPGRPGQVVYINGSVSATSLIGGMNEFIWDPQFNQFEFGDSGLVRARRDVLAGEVCYIGYGEDYDWDGVKVSLVHELASTLLLGVEIFGHPSYLPPWPRLWHCC
jgi:hypothetical protein